MHRRNDLASSARHYKKLLQLRLHAIQFGEEEAEATGDGKDGVNNDESNQGGRMMREKKKRRLMSRRNKRGGVDEDEDEDDKGGSNGGDSRQASSSASSDSGRSIPAVSTRREPERLTSYVALLSRRREELRRRRRLLSQSQLQQHAAAGWRRRSSSIGRPHSGDSHPAKSSSITTGDISTTFSVRIRDEDSKEEQDRVDDDSDSNDIDGDNGGNDNGSLTTVPNDLHFGMTYFYAPRFVSDAAGSAAAAALATKTNPHGHRQDKGIGEGKDEDDDEAASMSTLLNLATAEYQSGNVTASSQLLRLAVKESRKVVQQSIMLSLSPRLLSSSLRSIVPVAHNNCAYILFECRDFKSAEVGFREALDVL